MLNVVEFSVHLSDEGFRKEQGTAMIRFVYGIQGLIASGRVGGTDTQ